MDERGHSLAALRDILWLWVPASLQMLTDWTRPLIFNLFVSRNIAASSLSPDASTLEEDAVGLAVMSLNLILFATAYGFNGAIDSYASVAYGAGDRRELFAILYRQGILLCGLSLLALLLLGNAERIYLLVGLRAPLARRAARLTQLMGWAVPGDFAYDALSRWMRGQQQHRLVATCSLAALCLSVGVNLGLASRSAPTTAPLLALIAQNSALPFVLAAAYYYVAQVRCAPSCAWPRAQHMPPPRRPISCVECVLRSPEGWPQAPPPTRAAKATPLLGARAAADAPPSTRQLLLGVCQSAARNPADTALFATHGRTPVSPGCVGTAAAVGAAARRARLDVVDVCRAVGVGAAGLRGVGARPGQRRRLHPALLHLLAPDLHVPGKPPQQMSLARRVHPRAVLPSIQVSAAGAASALIGEALGKGDVLRAAAMLRAASALVLLMVAGYAGALLPLRGALAALLGGGVAAVEAAYARTLPVVLAMHLLDGCDLPRPPDISRDLPRSAVCCPGVPHTRASLRKSRLPSAAGPSAATAAQAVQRL